MNDRWEEWARTWQDTPTWRRTIVVPVDPSLVLLPHTGPCWWCGRETFLLDVCYGDYFCGSDEDEREIAEDLRRLAQKGEAQSS